MLVSGRVAGMFLLCPQNSQAIEFFFGKNRMFSPSASYLDVPLEVNGSMGYNLLINGVYWGYNPLTNHYNYNIHYSTKIYGRYPNSFEPSQASHKKRQLIPTRWALTSSKWGYNPCKWPKNIGNWGYNSTHWGV